MPFAVAVPARLFWGHAPRVRSAAVVRRAFATVSDRSLGYVVQ